MFRCVLAGSCDDQWFLVVKLVTLDVTRLMVVLNFHEEL
jgi:hypothetical protein